MKNDWIKHVARAAARKLFTDGRGIHYSHLSLDNESRLGWSEEAVADELAAILETTIEKSERKGESRRPR